jgi:hypothetical protein
MNYSKWQRTHLKYVFSTPEYRQINSCVCMKRAYLCNLHLLLIMICTEQETVEDVGCFREKVDERAR